MTTLASAIRKHAPRRVVRFLRGAKGFGRRVACDVADLREKLSGRAQPLTPPRRMWELVGGGDADFHSLGQSQVKLLKAHGLQPYHQVLDVGSGIGRLASPLTQYLKAPGGFDGVEIIPEAVSWCQRVITSACPTFRFHRADVRNDRYNPAGRTPASSYVFPFADETFDFVFLGSVFTHMYAPDMRNYFSEIVRVMKPGGTCVISYYLLDVARRQQPAAPGSALRFDTALDGCWCAFPDLPEAAIAFERRIVEQLYEASGMRILELIRGNWDSSGRQDQDIVIAVKQSLTGS